MAEKINFYKLNKDGVFEHGPNVARGVIIEEVNKIDRGEEREKVFTGTDYFSGDQKNPEMIDPDFVQTLIDKKLLTLSAGKNLNEIVTSIRNQSQSV